MFGKILVAVDGSKHSERASEVGMEMAVLYHSSVMALHVVDVGKEYASLGDLSSKSSNDLIANIRITLFKQGDEATKRVEELARKENIPVQCKVIEGNPAKDILKTAKEGQMDLIVLGSIGVTGLDKFLLGSVAEKVIHNSRVPVMVVS